MINSIRDLILTLYHTFEASPKVFWASLPLDGIRSASINDSHVLKGFASSLEDERKLLLKEEGLEYKI